MKNLFPRYIWLVDTIYRAGNITFEEINRRWLRNDLSEGKTIPLRTFHNHRQAIEELFDINIECNKHDYSYFIENKEDMQRGGVRTWLLNTFAVNNLINESHKLKSRILFEQIPSGQHFLTPIIEAMRDNLAVKIEHQSFWHETSSEFEIEPYCVKVFKQRWYVVGKSAKGLFVYGLDRIKSLQTTERKFSLPKNFDAEDLFRNFFGIIIGAEKPCLIRLKVFDNQRKYIRSLPFHHSQKEVEILEDYSVFEMFVAPTFDFKQEILSHGNEIEVLAPEFLRKEFKDITLKMGKIYC